MVVKTFRGLLADAGQDRIRLTTIRGKVGYQIVKFQIIAEDMNEDGEFVVSIFKTKQGTVPITFDFTDTDLLGAAFLRVAKTAPGLNMSTIVFDNEIFNQDVYVMSNDVGGSSAACNYYLELEVLTLSDDEAQAAILKSIRTG